MDEDLNWSGATEITEGGTYSNQTYTSTTADENSVLIDTDDAVTLENPTVTKSGGSDSSDNASFYGINSAVMIKGGTNTTIRGGSVNTSTAGANGIFSYGGNGGRNGASGDGTTVYVIDTRITTTSDNSGGIMTTGGGSTAASNLTVTTSGRSSAAIRSDRGGGTVYVDGGSYTSSGLGSPAIYSTADITVENATLTSNRSEGICIEGKNSVTLTDCTLTANNTQTNGNAQFLDAIMIYQSQSGDAASGTSTFTMTGGTINNRSGHVFHVTNTNAVINLENVTINDSGDGILISVCDDGWSGASNAATLNASGQTLSGDILVGDDSSLTLNISDSSTFTGNISGSITNASGSSISSEIGTVNVTLDDTSTWNLTGDTYVSSFTGNSANVITNGYNLYVNGTALDGTSNSDSSGDSVAAGLALSADGNTLTADSDFTGDTINLTDYPGVQTLNAAQTSSNVSIIGNAQDNSIAAGNGVNMIWGNVGNNTLTGGAVADTFYYTGAGNDLVTNYAVDTDDLILRDTTFASVTRNGSTISIVSTNGNALILQTDSTADDLISYSVDGETFTDAKIADAGTTEIAYSDDIKYFALGSEGTLIVDGEDRHEINLDGTLGQEFFNISNINASNSTGENILMGDAKSNIIIGGSGTNYLWGGSGSESDILIGGAGADVFYFGQSDGNDTIQNASASDRVSLYDVNLSDIVSTSENNGVISVALSTGNVVAVESTENLSPTFNLADSSSWKYNRESQSWQNA